jgi:hypothetical protein
MIDQPPIDIIKIEIRITDLITIGITQSLDFIPDLIRIVPVITVTEGDQITLTKTVAGIHIPGMTNILLLQIARNLFRIPLLPGIDDLDRVVFRTIVQNNQV